MLRKRNKKNGEKVTEYLYECNSCTFIYWSDSRKLFMTCPVCMKKKHKSKMRLSY